MYLSKLAEDEAGATAMEYGLILALIAAACITAFQMLAGELIEIIQTVITAMSSWRTP
jgi:pilus assembly protein Flp/PilA